MSINRQIKSHLYKMWIYWKIGRAQRTYIPLQRISVKQYKMYERALESGVGIVFSWTGAVFVVVFFLLLPSVVFVCFFLRSEEIIWQISKTKICSLLSFHFRARNHSIWSDRHIKFNIVIELIHIIGRDKIESTVQTLETDCATEWKEKIKVFDWCFVSLKIDWMCAVYWFCMVFFDAILATNGIFNLKREFFFHNVEFQTMNLSRRKWEKKTAQKLYPLTRKQRTHWDPREDDSSFYFNRNKTRLAHCSCYTFYFAMPEHFVFSMSVYFLFFFCLSHSVLLFVSERMNVCARARV